MPRRSKRELVRKWTGLLEGIPTWYVERRLPELIQQYGRTKPALYFLTALNREWQRTGHKEPPRPATATSSGPTSILAIVTKLIAQYAPPSSGASSPNPSGASGGAG